MYFDDAWLRLKTNHLNALRDVRDTAFGELINLALG